MEVSSAADISLAIRIAQQAKQSLGDRFQVDLNEVTQRSTLIVRSEWGTSRNDATPKIFDFVELPATNILSSKVRGSFYSLKQAESNRKAVLEQYNMLQ